jgi:hypothetical protein
MPREALAAAFVELSQLNRRLRLSPPQALEVVADGAVLVHLEQRPSAGAPPRPLTRPMDPERLLTLLQGMSLALDLDAGLAPSPSLFRSSASVSGQPLGPETSAPGPAQEPH